MKTTLLEINLNTLEDYTDFQKSNADWNILAYLNFKYDINAAVAFSKIFFPDFIVVKGCVVLSFLHSKDTFESWYSELNGNITEIEKMCNLYELKDFFHINTIDDNTLLLDELGKCFKKSWEFNLSQLFPDKSFQVDVFEEYESKFITFYSKAKESPGG